MVISSGLKSTLVPRRHAPPQQPTSISAARSSPGGVNFEKNILKNNKNVSILELKKLLHTYNNDRLTVWRIVEYLDGRRQTQKEHGKLHFEAGPIVEVLSATISPHNVDVTKPPTIYGRIYLEFHHIFDGEITTRDLFNRGRDDPEILGSSRSLTFTSPDDTFRACNLCIPLHVVSDTQQDGEVHVVSDIKEEDEEEKEEEDEEDDDDEEDEEEEEDDDEEAHAFTFFTFHCRVCYDVFLP